LREGEMSTAEVFSPPALGGTGPASGKWAREYEAFLRLLPGLLQSHRGQYVAVHDGKVVGAGPDKLVVARKAYQEFGPVEILVRFVTDEPPRVVRIASPQVDRPGGG
jgi:hypothetical protein